MHVARAALRGDSAPLPSEDKSEEGSTSQPLPSEGDVPSDDESDAYNSLAPDQQTAFRLHMSARIGRSLSAKAISRALGETDPSESPAPGASVPDRPPSPFSDALSDDPPPTRGWCRRLLACALLTATAATALLNMALAHGASLGARHRITRVKKLGVLTAGARQCAHLAPGTPEFRLCRAAVEKAAAEEAKRRPSPPPLPVCTVSSSHR